MECVNKYVLFRPLCSSTWLKTKLNHCIFRLTKLVITSLISSLKYKLVHNIRPKGLRFILTFFLLMLFSYQRRSQIQFWFILNQFFRLKWKFWYITAQLAFLWYATYCRLSYFDPIDHSRAQNGHVWPYKYIFIGFWPRLMIYGQLAFIWYARW